jgi:hypothetical protein
VQSNSLRPAYPGRAFAENAEFSGVSRDREGEFDAERRDRGARLRADNLDAYGTADEPLT